jgi:hypothetical protein
VVHDNSVIYDVLEIQGFPAVPIQMTIATVLALLFLSLGYRMGAGNVQFVERQIDFTFPRSRRFVVIALALIGWGYLSAVLFPNVDAIENLGGNGYGVNTGTTAWLTDSIQFASTGTTALYIVTGNLLLSLALAIPWFIIRVSEGWSRVVLIAYFAALFSVSLARQRRRQLSFTFVMQSLAITLGLVFSILVFLPAAGAIRTSGANFFSLTAKDLSDTFWKNFDSTAVSETGKDISGFETTVYMIETRQRPTYGMYYAYFYFIKPIPRTLWKSKPLPPDLAEWVVGVQEDTKFFGLAAGSIGDALFAWGWIGIPLEFFLTGWAFRRLERRCVDQQPTVSAMLAYAGFFSLLPQLGRDSFIHMISERWLFVYGIPVFLFWYFDPDRVKARNPDHGAGQRTLQMRPSSRCA